MNFWEGYQRGNNQNESTFGVQYKGVEKPHVCWALLGAPINASQMLALPVGKVNNCSPREQEMMDQTDSLYVWLITDTPYYLNDGISSRFINYYLTCYHSQAYMSLKKVPGVKPGKQCSAVQCCQLPGSEHCSLFIQRCCCWGNEGKPTQNSLH